jgi:transcription elongation GreA/GreB family factor
MRRVRSVDPLRHPDLVEVTRRIRSHYDRVLQAELDAAAILQRRRQTLRDRLIEAEDRGERVAVTTTAGSTFEGPVAGVGLDYVIVGDTTVATFHIVSADPA